MSRSSLPFSRKWLVLVSLFVGLLPACSESHPTWREQKLPSGRAVQVLFMTLAWGVEHDERFPDRDAFALWYVTRLPEGGPEEREQEAREVFELIRPISEQWGFRSASLSAYRTPQRGRYYDLFLFNRSNDGQWACTPSDIGHPR
jgi:hypothetical protein